MKWFERHPETGTDESGPALDRIERLLSFAKKNGLATISFKDPQFGEVRAAFYQQASVVTGVEGVEPPSMEDQIRQQVSALTGMPVSSISLPRGMRPAKNG